MQFQDHICILIWVYNIIYIWVICILVLPQVKLVWFFFFCLVCAGRDTSNYSICLTDIQSSGKGFSQRQKVNCSVKSVTDVHYITSVFVRTSANNIILCVCEHFTS